MSPAAPGGLHALPEPGAHARAVSERLVEALRARIAAAGGALPFSAFMEDCLYLPGLGYYSAGARKFGEAGDFVTAPEVSPLFGRCLAETCAAVLGQSGGDILEFGAGSGALAVDLLGELERLGQLPGRYLVLERSADLRETQRRRLAADLPGLAGRVEWLDALPAARFRGVAIANEVLDAMPVECFRWTGTGVEQAFVTVTAAGFDREWRPATDARLVAAVRAVHAACGLEPGYCSEVSLAIAPWLASVAGLLDRGLLLCCDYGYPRREYYHPQRGTGTLMCHYRHRAHPDPFTWPGLQDITAHVDFTAVAEAAVEAGLDVIGYTSQAAFLFDSGVDARLAASGPVGSAAYLRAAQQVKRLTLPGEMGERFRCIGLGRGIEAPLPGFRMLDLRGRL